MPNEVRVKKVTRLGKGHLFEASQSSVHTTNEKISHPRPNDEEENSPPLKTQKTDDPNLQTPPANVKNSTSRSPPSSSPDSSITQKSGKRKRSDEDVLPVAWNMQYGDEDEDGDETAASPENKLIKHLKKFSEMEPSLKRTDSLVCDLLTDSKFADACMDVVRGMKQLKEGLKTITKVRELLCERTKSDHI